MSIVVFSAGFSLLLLALQDIYLWESFLPCVVAIANGTHNAAFLFERDVQERVAQMGLITKDRLNRNKKLFKFITLPVLIAFVLWAVYGINGAKGFWTPFWQILLLAMAEGLFDRFFIDWYWVGHITTLCDQPTTGEDCFFTVLRFDL